MQVGWAVIPFPMRRVLPGHPIAPPLDILPLVLDFIVRQLLHKLALIGFGIPTSAFWQFLTIVPTLFFSVSTVIEASAIVQTPVFHSLALNRNPDIEQSVIRPQSMQCLTALRHLSFCSPGEGWAGTLIERGSPALEHTHTNCSDHPLPLTEVLKSFRKGRVAAPNLLDSVATEE
ncbi:hypothetical protein MSAN_01928100 [Mycena sanguinolenta]|uniref:Uncharacterized protein n=1 Tax=Mycena sanguinolenta TaxID=230812 RepID=A0A8H6XQE9_9AGAR|nr:hypothetical protein MSAN_01928100 [Mycena sanguinolenta]